MWRNISSSPGHQTLPPESKERFKQALKRNLMPEIPGATEGWTPTLPALKQLSPRYQKRANNPKKGAEILPESRDLTPLSLPGLEAENALFSCALGLFLDLWAPFSLN